MTAVVVAALSVTAASTVGRFVVTPMLTVNVSGVPLTWPVPVTVTPSPRPSLVEPDGADTSTLVGVPQPVKRAAIPKAAATTRNRLVRMTAGRRRTGFMSAPGVGWLL